MENRSFCENSKNKFFLGGTGQGGGPVGGFRGDGNGELKLL